MESNEFNGCAATRVSDRADQLVVVREAVVLSILTLDMIPRFPNGALMSKRTNTRLSPFYL